ncbi:hypothetical protein B0H14DRAFT_3137534 [Mycena olivaceomarginata]|nr:hypothetical protein B0H14DRAFT_3137534 [Mycena olivaceomarginata]
MTTTNPTPCRRLLSCKVVHSNRVSGTHSVPAPREWNGPPAQISPETPSDVIARPLQLRHIGKPPKLQHTPRAPITNVQIESWRENPELLLGAEEVLVGDIQDDGESVAFQLRAIMITIGTGGLRKDFYVLITDEDTAYPFKDEHFWEVLGKATLVLRRFPDGSTGSPKGEKREKECKKRKIAGNSRKFTWPCWLAAVR